MFSSKFIVFNGNLISSQSPVLKADNKAVYNGEIITETIYANGARIFFLNEHYEKIIKTLALLDFELPQDFSSSLLNKIVSRLLNANKFLQGAIIKIVFFRNDGNDQLLLSCKTLYIITSEEAEDSKYVFNKKGLRLGLFTEIKKTVNLFSGIKFANSYLYIKAKKFNKENNFDDCFIINEKENVIETIYSNLFFVKDNIIYMPSVNEGSNEEIMQEQTKKLALKLNYKVIDNCIIKTNDLLIADEIFLTNVEYGIRWVVAFEDKRYYCKISKNIFDELMRNCF
jgi:branched-subunit amino acid aminotransferase/4-amino-4-deoxychorismate lyase